MKFHFLNRCMVGDVIMAARSASMAFKQGGSLSCHTSRDMLLWFTRSRIKNRSIKSPCMTNKECQVITGIPKCTCVWWCRLAHCKANNYFLNYNTRSGTALQAVPDGVYEKNWTLNNRPDKPNEIIFSSPELKVQVGSSDCLSSVVSPTVCPSVNFSHFHLLLQNHSAIFNQTWLKAFLGGGDSSLFKWRATLFFKGK